MAAALLFACPAQAQTLTHIDSTPADGWVNGLGAIQVSLSGLTDGEFSPPSEQPAHAGLELTQNGLYSPVSDTNREPLQGPTLTHPTATSTLVTSKFQVGDLVVDERATMADGKAELALSYRITNSGTATLPVHAAEIGELPRLERGIYEPDTFVGASDQLGRRTGLVAGTPWTHHEVGPSPFSHMQTTHQLTDTTAAGFQDQAVGAEWDASLAPGAHYDFDVSWSFSVPVSTLNVNSTADHDNGACDSADCTLREALVYAPAGATINLPPGTYALAAHELTSDQDNVSIVGRDTRRTIIDGADKVRVLEVRHGSLTATGVTFTRGDGTVGDTFAPKAGAFARDIGDGTGGAIAVAAAAELDLTDVAVTASNATVTGGGIANQGDLEIERSLIAHNNSGAGGGGISTTDATPGSAYTGLLGTTVSDNAAGGNGGGIYVGGETTLVEATIAGNRGGGGVYRYPDTTLRFSHTIVAGNTPTACAGPITDNSSYDLDDDHSCFTGTTDKPGVDPKLLALGNHGGQTDTRALVPGSPAIDAAGTSCSETDQRGIARPQHDNCDIGAYEASEDALKPLGHIGSNPLDVYATGMGRLQLRFNTQARGLFSPTTTEPGDAGLAVFENGIYYPAGGGDYGQTTGLRMAVSGPDLLTTEAGERTLRSSYYVGPDLLVTESVGYNEGSRSIGLRYEVKNVAGKAVSFRSAEIGSLGQTSTAVRAPGALTARAANGQSVGLVKLPGSDWQASLMGNQGDSSDVYSAFVANTTTDTDVASGNNQIGADFGTINLATDQTVALEVNWEVAQPTSKVAVTTTADHNDGKCDSDCTLREALLYGTAGAVINVPQGHYTLTGGPLAISQDRMMLGEDARQTIIDGGGKSRVFTITKAAVGISDMTITGGVSHSLGSGDDNGGGGGIYVVGGYLALVDTTVRDNEATIGGGIYGSGGFWSARSTISGNKAIAGPGDQGANQLGGGALLVGENWIVNTTISGNSAVAGGGGLLAFGSNHYENATIAANQAPVGAGLYNSPSPTGTTNPDDPFPSGLTPSAFSGTIVAGNSGGPQCATNGPAVTSYDLSSDASCGFDGDGDLPSTDPKLGPLANNDGGLDTQALLSGSPARDAMTLGNCPADDGRGALRPFHGFCDMGAIERAAPGGDPPDRPVITAPAEGANVKSAVLSGTAEPGAQIDVRNADNGDQYGSGTAGGDGTWSVSLKLGGDGAYTVSVTASNAAGSSPTALRTFVFDTTPPATPTLDRPAADGSTVTLTGTASEETALVRAYDAGVVVGATTPGVGGAWTIVLDDVADGGHDYTPHAYDQAGNDATGSPRELGLDSTAPVITSGPTGVITANSAQFTFTPGGDATFVCQLVGREPSASKCASGVPYGTLANGTYTLKVWRTYLYGRSAAATRTFTVDLTAPEAPVVATSGEQGPNFTLTGSAEPASTVSIFEGDTKLGEATAASDGTWTFPISGAAPGQHAYSASARDAAGRESARSSVSSVHVAPAVVVAQQTPTPAATPTPLPPPVVNQDVNVVPAPGTTVLIKLPGTNKFVPLAAGQQLPVGTEIDTTHGRVTLTSAVDKSGKTQTAAFYDGIFKVTQSKGVTVLTLTEALSCPKAGKAAVAGKKKKTRRLWGSGKGNFRTTGKYSAATIRGTTWLTQDTCTTTVTKVTQGVVSVNDFVARKTFVVKPGKPHTARARKH